MFGAGVEAVERVRTLGGVQTGVEELAPLPVGEAVLAVALVDAQPVVQGDTEAVVEAGLLRTRVELVAVGAGVAVHTLALAAVVGRGLTEAAVATGTLHLAHVVVLTPVPVEAPGALASGLLVTLEHTAAPVAVVLLLARVHHLAVGTLVVGLADAEVVVLAVVVARDVLTLALVLTGLLETLVVVLAVRPPEPGGLHAAARVLVVALVGAESPVLAGVTGDAQVLVLAELPTPGLVAAACELSFGVGVDAALAMPVAFLPRSTRVAEKINKYLQYIQI